MWARLQWRRNGPGHALRWRRAWRLHPGFDIQVCWLWWRWQFQQCHPQQGFHLLHLHLFIVDMSAPECTHVFALANGERLRRRQGELAAIVEPGQTGLLLQNREHRLSCCCSTCPRRTSGPIRPSRPLQLRRWCVELEGRLVSPKEAVVLRDPWQGLPGKR